MSKMKEECSYQTIQSDPKGQFGQLWRQIQSAPKYKDKMQEFVDLEEPNDYIYS